MLPAGLVHEGDPDRPLAARVARHLLARGESLPTWLAAEDEMAEDD